MGLGGGVVPPVGGPEVLAVPAEAFEDGLAEFVAIAGGGGGAVGGSVAFDAEEVAARIVGMKDGEIDAVAGAADLAMDFVAVGAQGVFDELFEAAV